MTTILSNVASHLGRDVQNPDLVSHHLLDTLGAWLAGRNFSEGKDILAAFSGPMSPFSSHVLDDIVREVAITRLTEIDDIHRASCTTCGSVIIPTAILLAQQTKPDAQTFLRAIVHGYEAMMRLGAAAHGPSILAKGIWPTYLVAPFGAAVTASILLKLDDTQAANAMALALQQTSGAPGGHPHGKTARWLLAGYAARSGVTSAMIAAQGFGGDLTLLDGDWFARTHAIQFDSTPFRTLAPVFHETSIKPWCSAKQTTSAIEAFLSLLSEGINPDTITKVEVCVPNAYQMMISGKPPGRLGRIVNVGWQLGLCAYAPELMLSLDRACGEVEAAITAFAEKVEVMADPELNAAYPQNWPARVVLNMADGSTHSWLSQSALGDPEIPMTDDAMRAKFDRATQGRAKSIAACLGEPLDDEQLNQLLDEVRSRLN